MKKFLGFAIITSFVCSYAMNSKEVSTLSIVNYARNRLVLTVTLKNQSPYKRCLVSRYYKDFFVIKDPDNNLEKLEVGIEGKNGVKQLDLKDKSKYMHSLLALSIANSGFGISDSFLPLEEPISMEYPEFNCLGGYITSRITDTTHYFPGAYLYVSNNYSTLGVYGQMNMDAIPAACLLNVLDNCTIEDVIRAYAELYEIWNPQWFDNPHQRAFAKRMMNVLNEKYELLSKKCLDIS
jgi:hypothetical protein